MYKCLIERTIHSKQTNWAAKVTQIPSITKTCSKISLFKETICHLPGIPPGHSKILKGNYDIAAKHIDTSRHGLPGK